MKNEQLERIAQKTGRLLDLKIERAANKQAAAQAAAASAPVAAPPSPPTAADRPKDLRDCTRSSNWAGKGAALRMMNMLSPHMPDAVFEQRRAFLKSRGVDHCHLFVCNLGDGEHAKPGYSIYGTGKWTGVMHAPVIDFMAGRIRTLLGDGLGIILWGCADDSKAYNKFIADNPEKYADDLAASGLLAYASAFCAGLELDEPGGLSAKQCDAFATALRRHFKGGIGAHQTSGHYSYSLLPSIDLCFFQVKPGASAAALVSKAREIRNRVNKPVCMFEIEREPARDKCAAILAGGAAFSVGNW